MNTEFEMRCILAKNIMDYFVKEIPYMEGLHGLNLSLIVDEGRYYKDFERDFNSVVSDINDVLEGFFFIEIRYSSFDEQSRFFTFSMSFHGQKISLKDCEWCNGSGVDFQHYPCPDCQGGGYKGGMDAVELENRILSLYDME